MSQDPETSRTGVAVDGPTSEQLLQAARRGSATALNDLFARHVSFLQRYARGRLPRWARTMTDTADLVQDALIQTIRRLSRFESRGQGALRAYLRTAVDNRLRDEFRRVARRGIPDELDDSLPTSPATSPFEEALASETEQRYRTSLERMRATDRELVVAHVELGYSIDQIAVMTGRRRTDSARVAVARALQRLAVEMNRD